MLRRVQECSLEIAERPRQVGQKLVAARGESVRWAMEREPMGTMKKSEIKESSQMDKCDYSQNQIVDQTAPDHWITKLWTYTGKNETKREPSSMISLWNLGPVACLGDFNGFSSVSSTPFSFSFKCAW